MGACIDGSGMDKRDARRCDVAASREDCVGRKEKCINTGCGQMP